MLQELLVILLDVGELMRDALPYAGQALRALVLNKVRERCSKPFACKQGVTTC